MIRTKALLAVLLAVFAAAPAFAADPAPARTHELAAHDHSPKMRSTAPTTRAART